MLARIQQKFKALRLLPLLSFQNDFERRFCNLRLDQQCLSITRMLAVLSVGYHLLSLVTDRFIVADADRQLFLIGHVIFLALHAIWWIFLTKTRIDLRRYLWCLQVLFICLMGFVLRRTIDRAVTADLILASSGLIVISSIMLLMCPFANYMVLVTAVIYEAIAAISFAPHPIGRRWIWIDVLVLTMITITQLYAAMRTKERALDEYRTLLRVAPRLVVQQALQYDT